MYELLTCVCISPKMNVVLVFEMRTQGHCAWETDSLYWGQGVKPWKICNFIWMCWLQKVGRLYPIPPCVQVTAIDKLHMSRTNDEWASRRTC